MAVLVGMRGQQTFDYAYDASGTITSGSTAQLVLPEQLQRSMLFFQNISATVMYLELGGARASCTISSGAVNTITVTNGGFGYTIPPKVEFYGGGDLTKNPTYLCPGLPGNVMPGNIPSARAILTAGAVSSIVIDNPGKNFVQAPFVFLKSREQDPFGAATPSATVGMYLAANGGSILFNGTSTPTSALSVFCSASSAAYSCKWML